MPGTDSNVNLSLGRGGDGDEGDGSVRGDEDGAGLRLLCTQDTVSSYRVRIEFMIFLQEKRITHEFLLVDQPFIHFIQMEHMSAG